MIQERGLIVTSDKEVKQTIEDNKWNLLCEHPDPAVVSVFRELYANGMERDEYNIFVKGKWVPFDWTTINNYYGLDNVEDEEYHAILDNDATNWDAIRDELCKVSVPWKRYTNGGLKSFASQAMTRTSKIWHYFVCAKLLPTTNFNDVVKNKAALVYAIQKKKKLDIGLIIQNSIIHGF